MRPLLASLSKATKFSSRSLQKGLHIQQQQNLSIFDSVCLRCRQQLQFRQRQQRNFNTGSRRLHQQPADDPQWVSPIDRPSQIVRVGRRHGPGLILLGTPLPLLVYKSLSLSLIIIQSSHPHNSLCPRNLASPKTRLENQTDRKIRRSTRQASSAFTTAHRSRGDSRI